MKFDDRLGNNQIESEQNEDLKNNALDDNEIRFFNKDIKNQKDQHREEEYKPHKNSEFESVPDFLLYDQMSEAEKKKHVQEKMEHEFKSPGNDFSFGKNYEDIHLKSSTNSLSDTNREV
ncbi:uncharacterized protein LOC123037498 [Drosophila rhopaloa]|uniref:Uncharacterized protein n=1 Tax=Drosophila rhopaloa TaxID=1041015 RepID=A0ABM5J6M7_DRORH|nr:uncharacterized protein LOC123037498 [Drosophila rhopaloa]